MKMIGTFSAGSAGHRALRVLTLLVLPTKPEALYEEIIAASLLSVPCHRYVPVVDRVISYKAWLEDERDTFSETRPPNDKFAALIKLTRMFDETSEFFIEKVGVNAATVWRWGTEKSRPAKYVGRALVIDLNQIMVKQIQQDIETLQTASRRPTIVVNNSHLTLG